MPRLLALALALLLVLLAGGCAICTPYYDTPGCRAGIPDLR